MKRFDFIVIAILVSMILVSRLLNLPLWLVCVSPCALVGLLLVLLFVFGSSSNSNTSIRSTGVEAEAKITRAESYTGDGMHPGDTCFKGAFEFYDAHGVRHVGTFNGYCYDPYDYLSQDRSLEFALEHYYQVGSPARVKYSPQDPSQYIFLGPKLTYIDKPSSGAG